MVPFLVSAVLLRGDCGAKRRMGPKRWNHNGLLPAVQIELTLYREMFYGE